MLVILIGTIANAQDYDEYRPEPRSNYNAANRYVQVESTTTAAPVAILKQINRHNEGMCLRNIYCM